MIKYNILNKHWFVTLKLVKCNCLYFFCSKVIHDNIKKCRRIFLTQYFEVHNLNENDWKCHILECFVKGNTCTWQLNNNQLVWFWETTFFFWFSIAFLKCLHSLCKFFFFFQWNDFEKLRLNYSKPQIVLLRVKLN